MVKRLRMFAGPNGSGKSTFIQKFPLAPNIKLGVYVNSDEIEIKLRQTFTLDMNEYLLSITTEDIQAHFKKSKFAPVKLLNKTLWKGFNVIDNVIIVNSKLEINSYIAADLSEFLRLKLLESNQSFSFETVMSDPGKLEFLELAKLEGYQIYLYYFCTKDPLININRVQLRVAQLGHDVKPKVIESRYFKSLTNLKKAVLLSHKAYLFDNSHVEKLIAEINEGENVKIIDDSNIPGWFIKYLVEA